MAFFEWLIGHIWPPPHPDPRQQQWQIGITMLGLFTAVGIAVLALASTSNIPGVQGFAQAADMAKLQQTAQGIEVRLIAQDIYEARKEQCRAVEAHDGLSKPGAQRRLSQLMEDYQRATGHEYRLPDCDEI